MGRDLQVDSSIVDLDEDLSSSGSRDWVVVSELDDFRPSGFFDLMNADQMMLEKLLVGHGVDERRRLSWF